MTTHSEKALTTLKIMGTKPENWQLCDIKWVKEKRMVPCEVECPSCYGEKFVRFEADGKTVILMPPGITYADKAELSQFDFYSTEWVKLHKAHEKKEKAQKEYLSLAIKEAGYDNERHTYGVLGNCPKCFKSFRASKFRSARMGSDGKVWGSKEAELWVGYPQWPEGTDFDSRFGGSSVKSGGVACGLCNKTIIKSGTIPVWGKDADNKVHGMWVGSDCAKKFLAVAKPPVLKNEENGRIIDGQV